MTSKPKIDEDEEMRVATTTITTTTPPTTQIEGEGEEEEEKETTAKKPGRFVVQCGETFDVNPIRPLTEIRAKGPLPYAKARMLWKSKDIFALAWPKLGKKYDDVWSATLIPIRGTGAVKGVIHVGTIIETYKRDLQYGVVMGILFYKSAKKAVLNLIEVIPGKTLADLAWTNVMDDNSPAGVIKGIIGDVFENAEQTKMFEKILRSWQYNYIADAVEMKWGSLPVEMRGKEWRLTVGRHLATGFMSSGESSNKVNEITNETVEKLALTYASIEWIGPYSDESYEKRSKAEFAPGKKHSSRAKKKSTSEINVVGMSSSESSSESSESSEKSDNDLPPPPRKKKSANRSTSSVSTANKNTNINSTALTTTSKPKPAPIIPVVPTIVTNTVSPTNSAISGNIGSAVNALADLEHSVSAVAAELVTFNDTAYKMLVELRVIAGAVCRLSDPQNSAPKP